MFTTNPIHEPCFYHCWPHNTADFGHLLNICTLLLQTSCLKKTPVLHLPLAVITERRKNPANKPTFPATANTTNQHLLSKTNLVIGFASQNSLSNRRTPNPTLPCPAFPFSCPTPNIALPTMTVWVHLYFSSFPNFANMTQPAICIWKFCQKLHSSKTA